MRAFLRRWLGITDPPETFFAQPASQEPRREPVNRHVYHEDPRIPVLMGQCDNVQRSLSDLLQKIRAMENMLGVVIVYDANGAVVCSLDNEKEWCREYVIAARQMKVALDAQAHWTAFLAKREREKADVVKAKAMKAWPK